MVERGGGGAEEQRRVVEEKEEVKRGIKQLNRVKKSNPLLT